MSASEPANPPLGSASAEWNARNAQLLFRTGLTGLFGLSIYFSLFAAVEDPLHWYQGMAMLVLSVVPALLWARRPDTSFPTFATFMLTGVNSFAIPLLGGHHQLEVYAPEIVSRAAWGVILFQVAALLAYRGVPATPRHSRFWVEPLFGSEVSTWLRQGMTLTTLYSGLAVFTTLIPGEIASVLRAVFFGLGTLCTFLLSRAWGAGELSSGDRLLFAVNLGLQALFLIVPLYLVGGLSMLVLALLGYVSGGRKVPVIPCLLVFAIVAVLHSGKSAMRLKYWENEGGTPPLFEVPAYLTEWVGYGLNPPSHEGRDALASRRLIERTSLLHMLTLVVNATPERQPFLEGETYGHILPQLVPRFFWPEKPLGHVSTTRLATYYGLQDEESTLKTTIGFGIVVESYANFGFVGLALIGFALGAGHKLVCTWTRFSPVLSYPGLFMILLLAWSFQTELPMSAWIASLYQAAIAVLGLPFVLKLVLR